MRSHFFLAAAVAALALPASASAAMAQGAGDPALAAFQSVCWKAAGDYVATVNAADADGWKETEVVAQPDDSVSITDKAAREKVTPAGDFKLLVTRGLRHMSNGADIKVSTCKLTSDKPDAGLIEAGEGWVGAQPVPGGDKTLATYFVKLGSGKPDSIPTSGVQSAMNAGGFGVLKFQQDPDAGIVVYEAYSK
ncbi:MAG: hypothetical protein ACREEW_19125 [Caulobacteraceae bacterium]